MILTSHAIAMKGCRKSTLSSKGEKVRLSLDNSNITHYSSVIRQLTDSGKFRGRCFVYRDL